MKKFTLKNEIFYLNFFSESAKLYVSLQLNHEWDIFL